MMTLDDVIIRLLYSSEFDATAGYVSAALIGTVFRAVSWCMAYTLLARGDGRIYLLTESLSGIAFLLLSYWGYHLGGLYGLGLAYSAWYVIYTLIVGIVYFSRYKMNLNRRVVLLSMVAMLLMTGCAWARIVDIRFIPAIVAIASSVIAFMVIKKMIASRRSS